MRDRKIHHLLGLATKAGKTVSGEFATENLIKSQKARLVLVAADASENTKKLFINKCGYYRIPCHIYSTKQALGQSMGKGERSSLGIRDEGFAEAIEGLLVTETKTEV